MKPYYEDKFCTIFHGDCREILPQLPKVDLVLTDPPYGLKLNSGTWGLAKDSKYSQWDSTIFPELSRIISFGRTQIVWGGNYYPLPPSRCWLTWYKPDAVPTMAHFEMAWTNLDKCARQISYSIAATNGERNGHPTQKPLAVMTWCLSFAPAADTILDPFMGSGTTLRAAKDLGRKAIGIEIEEKYCEIAAQRLSQEVLNLQTPKIESES